MDWRADSNWEELIVTVKKSVEQKAAMDRDIVAVLNIQMRGEGFPQRAPNEITKREELSRGNETPSIST